MLRNDVQAVESFAEFLIKGYPGALIELIAFNAWYNADTKHFVPPSGHGCTIAGLFSRWDHVSCAAARVKGVSLYICPNPIASSAGWAASNRLEIIKDNEYIASSDIEFLRWLCIDIDPIVHGGRSGLNSTETEHQACQDLMNLILGREPMINEASLYGSSGNGSFILVRLDDLPINDETKATVTAFVNTLILKYPDQAVEIDRLSRDISKKIALPGSIKCRGPHSEERPRRLVTIHGTDRPVKPLDLKAWLSQNGVEAPTIAQAPPGRLYVPQPPVRVSGPGMTDTEECGLWLADQAPAIEGKEGRRVTFRTICCALKGWDLSQQETLVVIAAWNQTCEPPWTTKQLIKIIRDADDAPNLRPRGYMRGCRRKLQPRKPKRPRAIAPQFNMDDFN